MSRVFFSFEEGFSAVTGQKETVGNQLIFNRLMLAVLSMHCCFFKFKIEVSAEPPSSDQMQ